MHHSTHQRKPRGDDLHNTRARWRLVGLAQDQSTGPKSPADKAVSANNAFKGGRGAKLRELTKAVNALLRAPCGRL